KIYIIDEVHMLSTAAFNALLKTLEEPPAHVKFMFATTDPEKVLPTILSRCQRFDLRRIPSALITKHLSEIAGKEKVTIDATALLAIARGADGGMRDAESTLDQLISFCGDKIEEADVLSMFGLAAQNQILELSRAVLAGEIHTALGELNSLAQGGKDLGRLLGDLLNHFRNLLIYQVSKGDLNLLEASEAEVAALKEQAALSKPDALARILEVFADAELRLRDAASKKILLEVTLLKAIDARNALPLDAVLKQLNQLRSNSGSTSSPVAALAPVKAAPAPAPAARFSLQEPTPPPPAPKAAAPATAPTPTSPTPTAAAPAPGNLIELWKSLLEAVGRVSPFTRGYLIDAHPVSFEKNIFVIGYDPEFEDHLGLVDNSRNHTLIATKLAELGHHQAMVKFIKSEAPANWERPAITPVAAPASGAKAASTTAGTKPAEPATATEKKPAPVAFNKDDFKNDPLIQKALEVFKGTIVEVRA
ncbi:MAG: DNA polymerase III subunit gamma/tau, partial [Verrucomicrobiota bacterium]